MKPNEILLIPSNCFDAEGFPPQYPYKVPEFDPRLLINSPSESLEEQYFKNQVLPAGLTQQERRDWILLEVERIARGCWFYNNGELTYMNGIYYIYLQYFDKTFSYMKVQSEYAFFIEFCEDDPDCLGGVIYKSRRAGGSSIMVAHIYRKCLLSRFSKFGLQSLSNNKVKKVLFNPIKQLHKNMPTFLKPKGKSLKTSISFDKGDDEEVDEENHEMAATHEYLENEIIAMSLNQSGFDGEKLALWVFDEIWKVEKVDVALLIDTHIKCIKNIIRDILVGKIFLVSTIGTDNNKMRKSIATAIEYLEGSDYLKRNEEGKTETGFYRYFLSAVDVLAVDIYGNANTEKNLKRIESDYNKKLEKFGENSKEVISEKREAPIYISDLFTTADATTTFGGRPTERLREILNTPKSQRGYLKCNFYRSIETGKIVADFENINPDFHFEINEYWHNNVPETALNNYRVIAGEIHPPRNPEIVLAVDSTAHSDVKTKQVSNTGVVALKMLNHYSKLEYDGVLAVVVALGRGDDLNHVNQQILYCAEYLGALLTYERNVSNLKDYAKLKGYLKVIGKSPFDGLLGIMKDTKGKMLEEAIPIIKDLIKKARKEGGNDFLANMPFEILARQLASYHPSLHGSHDLIAALCVCVIQCLTLQKTIESNDSDFYRRIATLF